MKVCNEYVKIRTGNKEKVLRNLILNNYLNLFAQSFAEFKNKTLNACLINFTNTNEITENSTEMKYDMVIFAEDKDIIRKYSQMEISTEYHYRNDIREIEIYKADDYSNWIGYTIQDIGFAHYDFGTGEYTLYAWIDVSMHNIMLQENQPLTISRKDKVTTDFLFYSKNSKIVCPYHLTVDGYIQYLDQEKKLYYPKLYSIGFGEFPYYLQKEYKVEELDIVQNENKVQINNIKGNYKSNTLYFSPNIYLGDELKLQEATWRYLVFVFHLWTRENPESSNYIDTGLEYRQYTELKKHGIINIDISYERSN